MLQTAGYPSLYPLNTNCTWKIRRNGKLLHVAFSDLRLSEAHTVALSTADVITENVTVGNHSELVNKTVLRPLASYSGHVVPSDVVTTSHEVWVTFNSKKPGPVDVGFRAGFESIGEIFMFTD